MVAFNRNLELQGQEAFFCGIQNIASEKDKVISLLNFCLRFWLVHRAEIVGHALVDSVTDFQNVLALMVNDHWEIVVCGDELFSCLEVVEPKVCDTKLGRELGGGLARSVVVGTSISLESDSIW